MNAVWPVIASNGVPSLQMRLVGPHPARGIERNQFGLVSVDLFLFGVPTRDANLSTRVQESFIAILQKYS